MRSVALLLGLGVMLIARAAMALTQLELRSEPGDYVGGGKSYSYTSADGALGVSGTTRVTVSFQGQDWWYALLSPPTGQAMAPGNYPFATRFSSKGRPGIDVFGNGRGCNRTSGRFTVHEYVLDAANNVAAFAADFVQRCDNSIGLLRGVIRINSSVPVQLTSPQAIAGYDQWAVERALVTLDGSQSYDPDGSIASYHWTQISGPPVTLEDGNKANARFRAPDVALAGADIELRLDVIDNNGNAASDTTAVHVLNRRAPRTFLRMAGEAGDYIVGNRRVLLTEDIAKFSQNLPYGAWFNFDAPDAFGNIGFSASHGVLPAVGSYSNATRTPFEENGPGLSVSYDGGGCNTLTGRFDITDADYSGGTVNRLGARFEQHCEGVTPAAYGVFRYRSASTTTPVARISAPATASPGAYVILDGTASTVQGGLLAAYRWRSLSHPTLPMIGGDTAQAALVMPVTGPVVLELEVTDEEGLVDFITHSIGSPGTVAVGASANPSLFGESVTFIATVAGNAPTGTVTFRNRDAVICNRIPLQAGHAQCPAGALAAGTYNITATYNGDAANAASAGNVYQTVNTVYTVTVTNDGPDEVTGAIVTDSAPSGLTIGTWTCAVTNPGLGGEVITGCGASSGSGPLNTTANLKVGGAVTYTIIGTVTAIQGVVSGTTSVRPPLGLINPGASCTPAYGNNARTFDAVSGTCSASDTDPVMP